MLKVSVLGAGRMGREIIRLIALSDDIGLAGVWFRGDAGRKPDLPESAGAALVSDNLDAVLNAAEIGVDFSLPGATAQVVDAALRTGTPLVCGVTGLGAADMQQIRAAATTIPLLYERNMSFGIALLKDLVSRAAPQLGDSFVAEIHETHHVHKKDAPSGTAIALGEALAKARKQHFADVYRYDHAGGTQRLSPEDIVFSVRREGEAAGEHTILFRSEMECLTLSHRVSDRRVFARGALRAARWLKGRAPGLYQMADVIRQGG